MNLRQAMGCVAFVVIATAALCGYIESRVYRFTMNDQSYEQVGVLEQDIEGQKLYLPIFRRVK